MRFVTTATATATATARGGQSLLVIRRAPFASFFFFSEFSDLSICCSAQPPTIMAARALTSALDRAGRLTSIELRTVRTRYQVQVLVPQIIRGWGIGDVDMTCEKIVQTRHSKSSLTLHGKRSRERLGVPYVRMDSVVVVRTVFFPLTITTRQEAMKEGRDQTKENERIVGRRRRRRGGGHGWRTTATATATATTPRRRRRQRRQHDNTTATRRQRNTNLALERDTLFSAPTTGRTNESTHRRSGGFTGRQAERRRAEDFFRPW
jgi:hypothetical protein